MMSGLLFLSKCILTHNLLYKVEHVPSAIFLEDESKCVVNDSFFKGSDMCETNGISINNASISLKGSFFKGFECALLIKSQ